MSTRFSSSCHRETVSSVVRSFTFLAVGKVGRVREQLRFEDSFRDFAKNRRAVLDLNCHFPVVVFLFFLGGGVATVLTIARRQGSLKGNTRASTGAKGANGFKCLRINTLEPAPL